MRNILVSLNGVQTPVIVESGTLGIASRLIRELSGEVGQAQAAVTAAGSAQAAAELARDEAEVATTSKADRDGANLTEPQAKAFRVIVGADNSDMTRAVAATKAIPGFVKSIRTTGYADPNDGGGALYVRSEGQADVPARCRFRTLDAYLPDGTTDASNGGYWVLKETAVNLRMVGGTPLPAGVDFRVEDRALLGPHSTSALDAAMGYIEATAGAYLLIDDYYYFNVCWQITTDGIVWQGVGAKRCGVRFAGISALYPSIDVQALSFTCRDMEICADDRGGSDPADSGHTGTCITTGKFYNAEAHAACSAVLENLYLTRAVNTRISHCLAAMGRTVAYTARNIEIDGLAGQNHQHGILMHWGCLQDAIGEDVNETYHPVIDCIENVTIKGAQRPAHLSAVTRASLNNIEWNGGGGIGVTIGDEGSVFASAEFAGRAFGNISITNVTARNITATPLGISSRAASKFELDETDTLRYFQEWMGVLCFDNWDVQSVDGSADYHLDLGNLRARSLSARNWRTRGTTATGVAVYVNRCMGDFAISGNFAGPAWVRDSVGVFNLDGCTFRPGATVDGLPSIGSGTYALQVTGRTDATSLDGNHSAGATTIVLASPLTQHIQLGDLIRVGTQKVFATDIFRAGCLSIATTPLPAAVTTGAAVVLDLRTYGIKGAVDLNGGESGLLADGVAGMRLSGTVRNFGFIGHNITNSVGTFEGIVFENGGLSRIASGSLNTACVDHGAGSYLTYSGCVYGLNSPYLNRAVRSAATALGGSHVGGVIHDFVTSALSFATPTYSAIQTLGMVRASTGVSVSPGSPKLWSPVPKIGAGTPTYTTSSPRVIELGSDQVKVEVSITVTDKAALTGALTVEGFPFSLTESNSSAICRVTGATGLTGTVMATANGSGVFLIEQMGATGVANLTDANIVNGMQLRFGFLLRRG